VRAILWQFNKVSENAILGGGEVIGNRRKRQKFLGVRIASTNLCYYWLPQTNNVLLIFGETLRPFRSRFRTENIQ
jgi:hypothetical protein